mgnify:CR=1 FL=1
MEQETDGRIPARRIFRTIEEKRKIVEEALRSPHSVAVVARQHGLNSNQLFAWRKLYLNGQLEPAVESGTAVRLLPVSVSEEPQRPTISIAVVPFLSSPSLKTSRVCLRPSAISSGVSNARRFAPTT